MDRILTELSNMIEENNNRSKKMFKEGYSSSIKISNLNLLPPVIDNNLLTEINKNRQKAIYKEIKLSKIDKNLSMRSTYTKSQLDYLKQSSSSSLSSNSDQANNGNNFKLERKGSFIVNNPSPILLNNLAQNTVERQDNDDSYESEIDLESYLNYFNRQHEVQDDRDDIVKKKNLIYNKLGPLIKGYLVRRLLRTKYVQRIIKLIKETTLYAIKFQQEKTSDKNNCITNNDIKMIDGIINKLQNALLDLHHVFFNLNAKQKMNIISDDRNLLSGHDFNL